MKNTKNTKKTTLHLERETLRLLRALELRDVEGGRPPLTGDSAVVCCA